MVLEKLEKNQITYYLISLFIGTIWGLSKRGEEALQYLDNWIEPVIALMLFAMFCQIPFLKIKSAFENKAFFKAILFGNFVLIPLFLWALQPVFPKEEIIKFGMLMVLLTPCIDYVIVFTHLGKGDSQSLLAATPMLFIFQIILLPIYLFLFISTESTNFIEFSPFFKALFYFLIIPLTCTIVVQFVAQKQPFGLKILRFTSWLPVPLMALTFFLIVATQVSTIERHLSSLIHVIPIYILFSFIAPLLGKFSSKIFNVNPFAARTVSFSMGTRNSLVILPVAFTFPSDISSLLIAVIVCQTSIEIVFELLYIKFIPKLIKL